MSYRFNGSDRQKIDPMVSPRQAFDALFGNFTPPSNAAEQARRAFLLLKRKSVLDMVQGHTQKLMARLGAADQMRISQHFDEIRDLERRVMAIPPAVAGACQLPTDPGQDPPLSGAQQYDPTTGKTTPLTTDSNYSDEEDRAHALCDIVHMAFACDLSRSITLMFTMSQSYLNVGKLTGVYNTIHNIGHSGSTPNVAKVIAWHMKHFGRLIAKIRDTQEGAGSMLDNFAGVFLHEAGHGFNPQDNQPFETHSTENMTALIAGRAGGLKGGKHVVATDKHPANVVISAMKAVGITGETLGEVSGAMPELLS
jgi:hypothetical protein